MKSLCVLLAAAIIQGEVCLLDVLEIGVPKLVPNAGICGFAWIDV